MSSIFLSQLLDILFVSVFYFGMNIFVDATAPDIRQGAFLLIIPSAALPLIFVYLDLVMKSRIYRAFADFNRTEKFRGHGPDPPFIPGSCAQGIHGAPPPGVSSLLPAALACHLVLLFVFYWGPQSLMAMAAKIFAPSLPIHAIMRLPEFAALHVIPLTAYTILISFVFAILVSGGGSNKVFLVSILDILSSSLRLTFSKSALPLLTPAAALNIAKFLFYSVLDHSIFGAGNLLYLAGINLMQFVSPVASFFIFLIAVKQIPKDK